MSAPDTDKSKRIIVEGQDDLSAVSNLWRRLIPGHKVPFIKACEGIENLAATFDKQVSSSDTLILGIVVDADDNAGNRYKSIRTMLEKTGIQTSLPLPQEIPAGGLVAPVVLEGKKLVRLGIWIMPGNVRPGAVEDFLLDMLPSEDDLREDVEKSLKRIEGTGKARYKTQQNGEYTYPVPLHKKAYISTWLAWQKNPRMLYGDAVASEKLMNKDGATCQSFVAWLKKLFLD